MKRTLLLTLIIVTILLNIMNTYAAGDYFSGVWGIISSSKIAVNGLALNMEREPISINDRLVVPVATVFSQFGAKVDWNEARNRLIITKDNDNIIMYIGYINCYVNGEIKRMESPAVLYNGTVMVPVRFVAESFNIPVGWSQKTSTVYLGEMPEEVKEEIPASGGGYSGVKGRIVVIDAGHGGTQNGAVYGGVKEKDLNLSIAKKLNEKLKELGIVTYMTRTNDSTLSLYARSDLANNKNADLLISVHNNAGASSVTGSMSLYYPSASKTKGKLSSYEFARIVQKNLVSTLGSKDLGVIERPGLAVLRTANMPAVIAEIGYMSNNTELNKLKTSSYQDKAAEALKKAIVESLEKMYK